MKSSNIHQSKFTLIVFGSLSAKGQSSLALFNYQLAKYLYELDKIDHIYCLGFEKNIDIPKDKISSLRDIILLKILLRLSKIFNYFTQIRTDRLVSELIFDFYFSYKLKCNTSNILLNLKPVNPNIVNKAKSKGMYVATLATIAHPVFILKQIKLIEKEFKIKDKSSYSNLYRVKRLSETFQKSDLVIPRSKALFIRNSYRDNDIVNIKHLHTDSFIDTNVFIPNENKVIKNKVNFLTAGIIELKKGLPLLLKAWSRLKTDFPNKYNQAELIIVGPIDNANSLIIKKYFHNLENVQYLGKTNKIADAYFNSDVFIASSISDLGPRTITEAISCGLPIISSNCCGHSTLVKEEENGFTYNPFDIDKLLEKIIWFIDNPSQIKLMGKKSRKVAMSIKPDDFNNELYKLCINEFSRFKEK